MAYSSARRKEGELRILSLEEGLEQCSELEDRGIQVRQLEMLDSAQLREVEVLLQEEELTRLEQPREVHVKQAAEEQGFDFRLVVSVLCFAEFAGEQQQEEVVVVEEGPLVVLEVQGVVVVEVDY